LRPVRSWSTGKQAGGWVVRLPCGHEVGLPPAAQVPIVSVEILDHQDHCPDLEGGQGASSWRSSGAWAGPPTFEIWDDPAYPDDDADAQEEP
jgi:hypothetical protein